MSRVAKKFIRLGTGPTELNAQDLSANYTAVNYTPVQVASEGTDKISAHLKGIDNYFTPGTDFIYDDFFAVGNSGSLGWTLTANGGSAAASTTGIDSTFQALGVISLTTGGFLATGGPSLSLGVNQVNFGYDQMNQEWRMGYPALSTGGAYTSSVGFFDNTGTGLDATDGIYFQYDQATSANWRCVTANNNARTKTTTTVPVAVQFYILSIVVNAAGSSVQFFIDGNLVATHATNIPTGNSRQTGPNCQINKTGALDVNPYTLVIDYFKQQTVR